ncbi:MAG: GNAT family N-acetyltransferase [Chloroflexota bacterium]|nr:GNAT family N-acetyltransferase [Chloroflexota bacterium]
MDPETISSERLDLPSLSAERIEALLAGDVATVGQATAAVYSPEWLEDNAGHLTRRARQMRGDPAIRRWLVRPIVLREGDHAVIGTINFHGPPDERGMLEVGYSLLPDFRGRGYAIEAVRALLGWAGSDPVVRVFRASVSPDNERSLHLIGKLGFVQIGEQMDEEDGLELVFERAAPIED